MNGEQTELNSRNNPDLIGHEAIEAHFVRDVAQSRLHHAYLLCGTQGIGKATFAYRLARHLLSRDGVVAPEIKQDEGLFGGMLPAQEPTAPVEEKSGKLSLHMAADEPLFNRVAQGSHTDLLVLSPDHEVKKTSKKREIKVEQARKVADFLALTPAESSYRVVIIDAIDALNIQASNALLKILEEPPENSLLLLVCHQPAKLLPTVVSRCQKMVFPSLSEVAFTQVLELLSASKNQVNQSKLYHLADGSVGKALQLLQYNGLAIYSNLLQAMRPSSTLAARQKFANSIHVLKDEAHWKLITELWQLILRQITVPNVSSIDPHSEEARILSELREQYSLEVWLSFYEQVQSMLRSGDVFHLERQQTVMAMLSPKQVIRHQVA